MQATRQDAAVVAVVADRRHGGGRLSHEGVTAIDRVVEGVLQAAEHATVANVKNAGLEVAACDPRCDHLDFPARGADTGESPGDDREGESGSDERGGHDERPSKGERQCRSKE